MCVRNRGTGRKGKRTKKTDTQRKGERKSLGKRARESEIERTRERGKGREGKREREVETSGQREEK